VWFTPCDGLSKAAERRQTSPRQPAQEASSHLTMNEQLSFRRYNVVSLSPLTLSCPGNYNQVRRGLLGGCRGAHSPRPPPTGLYPLVVRFLGSWLQRNRVLSSERAAEEAERQLEEA
jgi:hypothetical protein